MIREYRCYCLGGCVCMFHLWHWSTHSARAHAGGSTQAAKLLKAASGSFWKQVAPGLVTSRTSMEQAFSPFTILHHISGIFREDQLCHAANFGFQLATCLGTGTLGRIRWWSSCAWCVSWECTLASSELDCTCAFLLPHSRPKGLCTRGFRGPGQARTLAGAVLKGGLSERFWCVWTGSVGGFRRDLEGSGK